MELLDGEWKGEEIVFGVANGSFLTLTMQVLSEFCVCLFPFSFLITLFWNILFGLGNYELSA